VALDELQDSAQPFHFVMQPHRMFEQFFALVRHEINQGIGAEREHPIAGSQSSRARGEHDRAQGQQGLEQEDSVRPGNPTG
jgi:hypothetical protein